MLQDAKKTIKGVFPSKQRRYYATSPQKKIARLPLTMSAHSWLSYRLLWMFFLISLWSVPVAGAFEATPLNTSNRGPLVEVFGLPSAEPARLTPTGTTAVAVTAEVVNMFIGAANAASGERLLLDGETYRWTLSVRKRITAGAEIGLELPVLLHGGGFLDGFIDGWHDAFGMPSGDREKADRGILTYRYERRGRTLVNLTRSTGGIGDLRITGAWSLFEDDRRALSLHSSIKIPTGDPNRLTGSGSVDGTVSLAASTAAETGLGTVSAFGSVGALGMTKGDVIGDRQKSVVGFGTLGTGWSPVDALCFTLQLNGNTGFFRSSLYQLADPSAQLVIGGTIAVDPSTHIDVGVVEDIAVATSPDVVFHLALRRTF